MSIRLKLTLIYTLILVVALTAFGGLVYATQVQSTMRIEEEALLMTAERMAGARKPPLDVDRPERPVPDQSVAPDQREAPPSFALGGFWQVRSADGLDVLDTQGEVDIELPISSEALEAAQKGDVWSDVAVVEGERLLIYTVPVFNNDGELTEIVQTGRTLQIRDESLASLARGLLVGGSMATVAAFGLGWILAGLSLQPLERLTLDAQAIGAKRDFSRRVQQTESADEVGRLASTLNSMLGELEDANQQTQRTLDLQRQFVADVSHELRTPLTTLHGNVELLRREPPISGEDRMEVLADMTSESQRLIRLVNDLLDLARADARRHVKSERVSLRPLGEEVCRQARLLAPDRTIDCSVSSELSVQGDPDALRQILLILLDNAVKHTDGAIGLSAYQDGKHVSVSVTDEGPGIPAKLLPDVFERFARGEEKHSGSGTGLGLAIAKALVEAQGGSIRVGSKPEIGTTFTVTLPRA